MIRSLISLSLVALLFSCGAEQPAGADTEEHIYDVICGCALEEVGECGEYIKIGEDWIAISGDLGLGKMPFCKKDGLRAHVHGEIRDGKFVAMEFDLVN